MSANINTLQSSVWVRSLLFGILLGVAVYAVGLRLDLWQMGRGNYVILMIIAGSMLLLPGYEKLSGLQRSMSG